jgi:hypothetical protein
MVEIVHLQELLVVEVVVELVLLDQITVVIQVVLVELA